MAAHIRIAVAVLHMILVRVIRLVVVIARVQAIRREAIQAVGLLMIGKKKRVIKW